ncbi:SusD/RagB family nutrient-binding outer membrane lipoprotein [Pedobacter nanyangensis]|uniref:SusD/RagB family nutrient-binding outer membrane lipoprotein n=1 Tax=Pedobacter nanyangensis TaxID=1562389 RepID=UPI000DE2EFB9|nr:SusD/RagB family nutrient-binding outer membrane lipoprotein [Pedobacter nanyangensis]
MRKHLNKIYSVLLTGIFITGCTKFDKDLNVDPNNPSKASGTQLIANSEFYLSSVGTSTYGVHYPQYLSLTLFPGSDLYNATSFSFNTFYTGPLNNLETVINSELNANEGPVNYQLAIAKILKAYFMWFMTDRWGDLPYSEALKGDKNYTPKYDKQQDIYNSLFTLLNEANTLIANSPTTGTVKNDFIYKGDAAKWRRLANTIRLLMALRLSKVDQIKGKAEFLAAQANGIMASNSDNLFYPHLAEAAHENFWYTSFTRSNRKWYAISKPLMDYMKPLNDPRLPIYADPASNGGQYVGLAYGTGVVVEPNDYSLLGAAVRKQNSPVYLVTYAQAQFALAEAAHLGWITGGDVAAETYYKNAITASISQWVGNTSGVAAYLLQPQVAYSSSNAIEKIATQRWVHLFLHGYEGWAEWRRTGYPVLAPAPAGSIPSIPRREGYPANESQINKASYNAAIAALPYGGADNLTTRVWWDKP